MRKGKYSQPVPTTPPLFLQVQEKVRKKVRKISGNQLWQKNLREAQREKDAE